MSCTSVARAVMAGVVQNRTWPFRFPKRFMTQQLHKSSNLSRHVGDVVSIEGWVAGVRSTGSLAFVALRLGGGTCQAIVEANTAGEELVTIAERLNREAFVRIEGTVRSDDRAEGGAEIVVASLQQLASADEWPLTGQQLTTELRVEQRHLYMRSRRQRAILRVRAALSASIRAWLDGEDFVLVDAPIFTPNVVEERTTLFETTRFQRMAYLSQSGQLYNEAASAAFGRVYSFGPVFRHESSPTRRHLAEFWMVEPELSGCDHVELNQWIERFVSAVVRDTAHRAGTELSQLGVDVDALRNIPATFERIRYEDAVREARDRGVDIAVGDDLSMEAESAITRDRVAPVFVTHYPTAVKPFYMKRDPDAPDRALCADLLAPHGYGEILGGGQREDDFKTLRANLEAEGLPLENFQWYLDVRRFGSVAHSGFGLGLERALAWICGLKAMDETIPWPRTPEISSP